MKFYELTRTLESYEKFIDEKTTVVLSADSELLKFINTSDPDLLNLSRRPKPLARRGVKTDKEG